MYLGRHGVGWLGRGCSSGPAVCPVHQRKVVSLHDGDDAHRALLCRQSGTTIAMSGALQRTDPRCKNRGPGSAEYAAALEQLAVIVKAMAAANAAKEPADK
jgi:hypothetical protein